MTNIRRLALLLAAPVGAFAGDIATDGSMGARVRLSDGPGGFVIPDTLGSRRGSNLFHSFETFRLESSGSKLNGTFRSERATFTQTQSGTISSIFARVTGGNPTFIDGELKSIVPGADLYLLNSDGVFFGPSATIDVDGSFIATTAGKLGFSDGAELFAKQPGGGDSLTSASIASFGFLTNTPASIVFSSSHIAMREGENLTAVGGEILIERAAVIPRPHVPPGAEITAPGGRITLTSMAAAGSVSLDGVPSYSGPRLRNAPGVKLMESSLDTSGARGGAISIRAPKLTLSQSTIGSTTRGDGAGDSLRLSISGRLELGDSSSIGTQTNGGGTAGNVHVRAGSARIAADSFLGSAATFDARNTASAGRVVIRVGQLTLAGGGRIAGSTDGAGRGGAVDVEVSRGLRIDGRGSPLPTGIMSDSTMPADAGRGGRGGDVKVRAAGIAIINSGSIGANTRGHGNGGNVSVVADNLAVERGGRIEANTGSVSAAGLTGGRGRGGNVSVRADAIALNGRSDERGTGVFANNDSPLETTRGGSIQIHAGTLSIRDGSLITTRLTGPGIAGDVSVKAGDIFIARSGSPLLTGIAADTALATSGTGGSARIEADRVSVTDGGQISSFTAGAGSGGSVSITAGELSIIGGKLPSVIGTESQSTGLGGNGGDVMIRAGNLTILTGGRISASTFGAGAAGDVRVHANDVFIDNGRSLEGTGILSESVSIDQPGDGGSVTVQAERLSLVSGGRISAGTFGPGDGGDVEVSADSAFFFAAGSDLLTGLLAASRSTTAAGKGGSIRGKFGTLSLKGGGISATTAGPGSGGSVFIEAGAVSLDSGSAIAASATGAGGAGSVEVVSASRIDLRGSSSITVRSALSDAGSIRLIAPDSITLQDSTVLAEAGLNGGDVFIDPEFVILDHSTISANAILGAGGNITLIADTFLASSSAVTASSEASVQGTVDIQSPDAQLANALTALPGGFLGAEIKLTDRCPMRLSSELSSFLVIGRGGLPPAPEDMR